jgi:hypothetical protein
LDLTLSLCFKRAVSAIGRLGRCEVSELLVVCAKEESAEFDAGIYGDHEYITFASEHVSDAFIPLLEGIRYIQRLKRPVETESRKEEPAGLP